MKKKLMLVMAAMLAFGASAGAVYAKQPEKQNTGAVTTKSDSDDSVKVTTEKPEDGTVTGDTYGKGPQGYHGLLNAINHVKDKPAGAVLANLLLTKYQVNLTPEQKAKLEAIANPQEALQATADTLDQQGDTTDAITVQKEAVKADTTNLNAYKALGKLYAKTGKKGVKLYVNGDEPAFQVAPFIKNDVTLVPFRAIAEALKATVTWNEQEQSVTVTRGDITVKLYVGSTTATINGKEVQLEVPAEIVQDSTVVPVRFLSEALKAKVDWEDETQSVVINQQ